MTPARPYSSMTPDRLPKPWRVVEKEECFIIESAEGYPIAYLYFADRPDPASTTKRLTKPQAKAVAAAFVKVGAL